MNANLIRTAASFPLALVIATGVTRFSGNIDSYRNEGAALSRLGARVVDELSDPRSCSRAFGSDAQFDAALATREAVAVGMPVELLLTRSGVGRLASSVMMKDPEIPLERVSLIDAFLYGSDPVKRTDHYSAVVAVSAGGSGGERRLVSVLLVVDRASRKILRCEDAPRENVLLCGRRGRIYLPPGVKAPYFQETFGTPDPDGCVSQNAVTPPGKRPES